MTPGEMIAVAVTLTLALVGSVVGGIIWGIRLEGKVTQLGKESDTNAFKIDQIDSKIVQELASLNKTVARIEGYLQATKEA